MGNNWKELLPVKQQMPNMVGNCIGIKYLTFCCIFPLTQIVYMVCFLRIAAMFTSTSIDDLTKEDAKVKSKKRRTTSSRTTIGNIEEVFLKRAKNDVILQQSGNSSAGSVATSNVAKHPEHGNVDLQSVQDVQYGEISRKNSPESEAHNDINDASLQ